MKKILATAFLITAISLAGFAQKTISGKVTSKKDGKPIGGALITVKDFPQVSVTSDANGTYSINIPDGGKVLTCTAAGWAPKVNGVGNKSTINFEMTSEMDEQQGKGKGKQKIKDAKVDKGGKAVK